MNEKRPQRRKYYVSPLIQGRLISRMAVYWCVYHIFLWHAMFLYHILHYRNAVRIGAATPMPLWDLYSSFAVENTTMLVCAALVFPLIFMDMIYLTHRIAGPLVRFQNTLRRMSEGEVVRHIQLRDGDLLDELRDAFNDYLDSLHERATPAATVEAASSLTSAASTLMPKGEPSDETQRVTIGYGALKPSPNAADDEEFSSILHDLRDIQSAMVPVKVGSTLVTDSESGSNELRID